MQEHRSGHTSAYSVSSDTPPDAAPDVAGGLGEGEGKLVFVGECWNVRAGAYAQGRGRIGCGNSGRERLVLGFQTQVSPSRNISILFQVVRQPINNTLPFSTNPMQRVRRHLGIRTGAQTYWGQCFEVRDEHQRNRQFYSQNRGYYSRNHGSTVAVSEGGGLVVSGGLASDEDKLSGVSFSRPLVVVPDDSIAENAIWEVYTQNAIATHLEHGILGMEMRGFRKVAYVLAVPDFRTRAGTDDSQVGEEYSGILHRAM